MTENRKAVLCHYEVRSVFGRGRCIMENSGSDEKSPSVLVSDGIRLPHEGPDVALWLVRDGRTRLIAQRQKNRFCHVGLVVRVDDKDGIHIQSSDDFLQPGDGFAVVKLGTVCVPGPMTRDLFRPTIIEPPPQLS